MRLTKWIVLGAAVLLASPVFATTYWGGFEDSENSIGSRSDYDYNDLVFTISSSSLILNTNTGVWFDRSSAGSLNTGAGAAGLAGTPFWNNSSLDGAGGNNIGWCIYGGGACNGGVGLAPGDKYLATATGGSVNDVSFSVNGDVTEQVTLSISSTADRFGWIALSDPATPHLFSSGVQGPLTFTPGGNFILFTTANGPAFSSAGVRGDNVTHFAFFAAIPEPSSIGLLGFALFSGALALRKRLKDAG
jgi:hypothetical protein